MAEIVKLKSVRDTYLYEMMNAGGIMDKNLTEIMTKGFVPEEKLLEQQISTIMMYYQYPLKNAVMNAYKNRTIRPMMFPEGITKTSKIPTCMPFILTGSQTGTPNAVAIIDNYAQIDKTTGLINIDKAKFYGFLEGAFIARGIQITFHTLRRSAIMYGEASSIWAYMFAKILNKQFALNTNRSSYDKIIYLGSKFFMINLLQMDESDLIDNYAMKNTKDGNPSMMKQLNMKMKETESPYANIGNFIQALANCGYLIISGLETLTVREYVMNFINTYQNTALFSLEHLSYFLFNVFSTINSVFLNNQYAFKDILGHSADKIYGYISNTVNNT